MKRSGNMDSCDSVQNQTHQRGKSVKFQLQEGSNPRMPGKTPSPTRTSQSCSPSTKRKSLSPKSASPASRQASPGKSPSPVRQVTPGKSPSPVRQATPGKSPSPVRKKSPKREKSASPARGTSGKGKKSAEAENKSPGNESAPVSASRKKNVVIKTPETTEKGLKVLDYSGQGMTVIPASLLSNKEVGILILASNNLRSLPLEVRRMKSLVKLDISRNGIRCTHPGDFTGLPQEMESLTELQELKVSECNLPYVPPAIWRLKNLQVLDLSRNKINILPPEIGNLLELRRLNLQQTNITSLPPEIAYCQELEEILLWGNSIETLPDTLPEMPKLRVLALNYRSFCGVVDPYMENLLKKRQINSEHIPLVVFELPALEVLDLESTKLNNLPDVYNIGLREFYLCRNFLQSIPPSIYNLRYLQILDMSFNMLTSLPEDIGRLRSLKVLRLNNNSFERVPPTIGQLLNLAELNMARNRIRRLPPEIQGLKELKTLILENNDLQSLPDEICELTNLETLDLTNNAIKVLPMRLYKLTNLKEAHGFRKLSKHGLWLYKNPLEQPSPEVWRTEKPEDIYTYLKKLVIKRTENLQRQKILVMGNSQCGKTSLVRVLAQGKSCLTEAMKDRTRLLEQSPCKTENNVSFVLNDFGGDEAYRLMHHLFLDRKALVMIVYDAYTFREEDYDHVIGRWLTMLTSYTPGVVVKLIATKCDLLDKMERPEINCVENTHDQQELLCDVQESILQLPQDVSQEKEADTDRPQDQSDLVCHLVKRQLHDSTRQLQAELESVQSDLNKMEGHGDLTETQEAVHKMLSSRNDRLKDILACPLKILPQVSVVSSTDSLQGIRELFNELEHLAIDRSLFPHAQRKVAENWNRLKSTLKLQKDYYLMWEHLEQTAAMFGVKGEELQECVQYYCDTGEMLWYPGISGLSEIVFHRPRVLVELLASLYRHDIQDFLRYPDNKVFHSKGHLTEQGFAVTKELFLKFGQVTRPLLTCLWFHQKMSQDTLSDLLELLPLLDLCYTIPEPDTLTAPLHERPLLVLPYYNQDADLTSLAEVWPEHTTTQEKALTVTYHFPVVFPFSVFEQVSAAIQDMVVTRMDWKHCIFAATESEKVLLWKNTSKENGPGTLLITVRGQDFQMMQDLMQDLMEVVTDLFKRFPGLYWKVEIQGSGIETFLKVL